MAERDPASGPSSMYLKFKKGVNPTHVHSSDYRLVVLPPALNDLHAVASDDIRQRRWRRGFTFGQRHGSNVELTREQPVN